MTFGLLAAIEAAGSKRRLARLLGISRQAISNWRHEIPVRRIIAIEQVTGVPRERLRPDLYRSAV